MDRSRGVTFPCLPWDLLQQLLLNCQAAGDKDLQAGEYPEQAMQQREGPGPEPLPVGFISLPQASPRKVPYQRFWSSGCYSAAVLLLAE